jgi:hypothetical protein
MVVLHIITLQGSDAVWFGKVLGRFLYIVWLFRQVRRVGVGSQCGGVASPGGLLVRHSLRQRARARARVRGGRGGVCCEMKKPPRALKKRS